MTDDDLALLTDLHLEGERQGPGSRAETLKALALSGLAGPDLHIADLGCGTGAQTLDLAAATGARITAVDFLPVFLDRLRARAAARVLDGQIETVEASIDALPFDPGSFDAIWSEGAIYNIGFAEGLAAWRPFLKPGGVLAVSELTWLTATRPAELTAHWDADYPQVATASVKIGQIEAAGYVPIGYFPLPKRAWLDTYYGPLAARLDAFEARHDTDAARAIAQAERDEIALYERYADYVSYGFYLARKTD